MSSSDEKKSMNCFVCTERFNSGTHTAINCPNEGCDYVACETCVCAYLLGQSSTNPKCMSCRKDWSFEFLSEVTSESFHNKDYRTHRTTITREREESLMPITQPLVKIEKIRKEKVDKIKKIQNENALFQNMIRENNKKILELRFERHSEVVVDKKREKFVRRCPINECKGFLSTSLKCGLCDGWVCKDCHCEKACKNDDDHKCNPDTVATVKLLASDTKNCPSCAVPICKIEGCFEPNTLIPCWDGTIKCASEICIGDSLIGDDGQKRTVLELVKGVDQMYKIIQNKGENYVVNSKHKLSLKITSNKNLSELHNMYKVLWFDHDNKLFRSKSFLIDNENNRPYIHLMAANFLDSIDSPDIIEMTVEEFISMPKSRQRELVGYRSNGTNWSSKKVTLDPRILGMWLGDGYSCGTDFSSQDTELIKYWDNWVKQNDAELVHAVAYRYKVRRFGQGLSRGSVGSETSDSCIGCTQHLSEYCDIKQDNNNLVKSGMRTNLLKDELSKYNLINNKHIPIQYMTNDRNTRLLLLAGIVDTDGYVSNNGKRVTIIKVNPVLSEQIITLSRSLGFVTMYRMRNKKQVKMPNSDELKDYNDQYEINISGDKLDQIPTLLMRKKCSQSETIVDLLRTSLTVEKVDKGEYYGWRLDGNKRFVLYDYTVVHNCDQMFCVECHTAFSWNTGEIEKGVIHNPHFYQWQRKQNRGVAPRVRGDVRCGGIPQIWEIESAIRRAGIDFPEVHECHRLIGHINNVVLLNYPNQPLGEDNTDLRIKYLMNELTDNAFISQLKKREKKREKDLAINMVLTMFTGTLGDLFGNMLVIKPEEIHNLIIQMTELRKYVNENLEKVRRRFKNKVPYISEQWREKSK